MDEAKSSIPDSVANEEFIDRILYEPSFFCEGRLAPSAFALTQKGETYISVFRNSYYCAKDIKFPQPRSEGDTVSGIAQLLTADVRDITSPNPLVGELSMLVKAKSTRLYPFHAGVFTKIDGVTVKNGKAHTSPLYMYVQKKLVRCSKVFKMSDIITPADDEAKDQS